MKICRARIVQSKAYNDKISLRPCKEDGDSIRNALALSGFEKGEKVAIVDKEFFEQLLELWFAQ